MNKFKANFRIASLLLWLFITTNQFIDSESNRLRSIRYDQQTGIDHYDASIESGNALESIQSRLPAAASSNNDNNNNNNQNGDSELSSVLNSLASRVNLAPPQQQRRTAKQAPEFSSQAPEPANELSKHDSEQESKVCLTEGCVKAAAEILKNMDQHVDPCNDFYRYSCGGWIDAQVIPDDKTSVSLFSVVQDELDSKLRLLIERPAEDELESPIVNEMRRLYDSCMNTSEYLGSMSSPDFHIP